jgi:hypothetical protein
MGEGPENGFNPRNLGLSGLTKAASVEDDTIRPSRTPTRMPHVQSQLRGQTARCTQVDPMGSLSVVKLGPLRSLRTVF